MSIAAEIARILAGRNAIRSKLVEMGMAQSTDNLDMLAAAVEGIEDRGAVSVTVQEGGTYTIPRGYHNGGGTVSGVSGGGSYGLQSKTVIPARLQQSVTPDAGYYGLSDVTVKPIPESCQDVSAVTAEAGDVLTGKIFVNAEGRTVTGTVPHNGEISQTIDGLTVSSVSIPAGYTSGGTVSLGSGIETALAAI